MKEQRAITDEIKFVALELYLADKVYSFTNLSENERGKYYHLAQVALRASKEFKAQL
jgi:hypothetical protein